MKILKEILFVENLLNFYRRFPEHLEHFGGSAFEGGSSSEIIKSLVEKSMLTGKHLKIFLNYETESK